ncbi:hypothetical protein [Glycomyces tritici]|uniref:Uncharacterized protein n=1 Tax=Glycomyces tritici TaxID=2665176 RepID=A0ABT7YVE4_9ACTN|nr:hypothetical protein [Glycomyces tritici]MDN3242603.1 hypothetical protein [Glycomyces tritici]
MAEQIFDAFPGWVEAVTTIAQVLLVVGAVAVVRPPCRPGVREALERH